MANFEDLKTAWQSQCGISQDRYDQIGLKVQDSSNRLESRIFQRDMRETAASALVFVLFLPGLFAAKNWVMWSGFAIEVMAGATIPFVLWWARRRKPTAFSAANFRDCIDVEIDFLNRQNWLLRMVTWWYLLPIYLGIVLITVGSTGFRFDPFQVAFCSVYLTVCTGLFVFIAWLNQAGRKKHFEPLLQYYEKMRSALESGEEFLMRLPEPPLGFLEPKPPRAPTRGRRWTWIILTFVVTALVAYGGHCTAQHFDARTGKFILYTAPVVALLMIVVSGIHRRSADGSASTPD